MTDDIKQMEHTMRLVRLINYNADPNSPPNDNTTADAEPLNLELMRGGTRDSDIESIDRIVQPGHEAEMDDPGELLFDCPDPDCGNRIYENRRIICDMVMCGDCWDYEYGEITLEELKERKEGARDE